MEIPSSHGGVVKELKVKIGDKVAEGSVVLLMEVAGEAGGSAVNSAGNTAVGSSANSAPTSPVSGSSEVKKEFAHGGIDKFAINNVATTINAPDAANFAGTADMDCDLLVLGAGPGGYSAAFRAADLGLKVILVERYAQLGGVCLNVGCIPSKALLHVAAVMDEVSHLGALGIEFGPPKINIDMLRSHKEKVIGKLTGGLAAMAKMRKVTTVRGVGQFVGANHVEVQETAGAHGQEKAGPPCCWITL